jgi:cytochrome c5
VRPLRLVPWSCAALLVACVTLACAAALRHATPEDVARLTPRWPGTTLEDLERGRRLYVRRCAGCHVLPLPATRAPEDWPRLVDEMAARARLGAEERSDVVRFLVAVASDPGGGGGH